MVSNSSGGSGKGRFLIGERRGKKGDGLQGKKSNFASFFHRVIVVVLQVEQDIEKLRTAIRFAGTHDFKGGSQTSAADDVIVEIEDAVTI